MTEPKRLTTAHGAPVGDNQNALTAGPHGPLLLQDYQLLEKMETFIRERVPERVVHAKGSGAYGTFTVTNDVSRYTKAKIFSEIGKSTDCLLRFSTVAGERGGTDAHRYRIGVNYAALPANKPQCPVHTYHRAGNAGAEVNYEPNSMGGPVEDARYLDPPLKVSGDADRYDHRVGNDDYTQPGNLFRLMNNDQKEQLFSNIAAAMDGVPERIQVRQLVHFYKADPDYACGVAGQLNLSHASEQVAALADLSLDELIAQTSTEAYTALQSTPEESLARAAG